VAVPPTLRSEGFTEQIGDIVLVCTGGSSSLYALNPANCGTTGVAACIALPTVNISVSLGTNATSRLINGNVSEALLLIDEPGSGLNPNTPQTVCSSASAGAGFGGCAQAAVLNAAGVPVMTSIGASGTLGTVPSNVYQGNIYSFAPNQVAFLGIPVLPPASSGATRTYRITNIRANMTQFSGAALPGTQQVNASVSISGSTSIAVTNAFLTAGFVQTSLATTVRNVNNTGGLSSTSSPYLQQQCTKLSFTPIGLLQYSENFGTAFKVRNSTCTNTGNGTQSCTQSTGSALTQNIPGTIYSTESGFELTTPNGTAGLADFGTRLYARFANIPSGVNIFVSLTNVTNTSVAATTYTAQLVATGPFPASGVVDGSVGLASLPLFTATTTVGGIGYLQLVPDSTGEAYAIWEVTSSNPATLLSFNFAYAQSYSVTSGINSPPIPSGSSSVTETVNMSYAPVPPVGSSSSTLQAWATASSSLNIPRFTDTSGSGSNALNISICQTALLFPFVTNIDGLDTGIAVANTSQDPFGTNLQNGVCQLYAYGNIGLPTSQPACSSSSTATGLFCLPCEASSGTCTGYSIAAGTVSATTVSAIAPGFEGYIIAVCNFSFAHGFAFITDVGLRNLAMGYLALVMADAPSRVTPESYGQ